MTQQVDEAIRALNAAKAWRHYHRHKDDPLWRARKRERDRSWGRAHSREVVERVKAWREANPERYREGERLRQRRLRQNPSVRQKQYDVTRRWRNTAIGKATMRAIAQRDRARKAGVISTGTGKSRLACIYHASGVCLYCRTAMKLCLDHWVPISRGGEDVPSNWVPACRSCNSSKQGRPGDEWTLNHFGSMALRRVLDFLEAA
jgi:5-methylcytosine-specific restriction endonuclease McrA